MEHIWSIHEELILPFHLDKTSVIKTIWFKVLTLHDNKKAEVAGRINFNLDDLINFIDYQELNYETKINWIKNRTGYPNDVNATTFYENLNIEMINQQY
jgi:hypothetical protein